MLPRTLPRFLFVLLSFVCAHTAFAADDVPDLLLVDHSQGLIMIRARGGRIVWTQKGTRLYEAWAQADGSVVYHTGTTVMKIFPDFTAGTGGRIAWTYQFGTGLNDTPPSGFIYTCTPVQDGRFLVTESGTYRLVELDQAGQVVHTIKLPEPKTKTGHPLRTARQTAAGTYIVAYFADGRFVEIDSTGKQLREIPMHPFCAKPNLSAYEALPLTDGRLLISCGLQDQVLILNREGQVDWKLTAADFPADFKFHWIAKVTMLSDGNVMVCNFSDKTSKFPLFAVTPDKQLAWTLVDPRVQGLSMAQVLTDTFTPAE